MGFTLTLIVAGHETTMNGIASTLWLIGAHPEAKRRLIADPSLIPAVVEKSLRLESPIQMMARTLTEDTVVEGVRMTAGDKLGLVWGAANLDEARFPDPEVFDIDRPANQHLAFGHGIHRCVGEQLARTEIRIAVEQILARIPDYRIAGEVRVSASTVMHRGPLTVPIAFAPGVRTGVV
jgi:cytochrome P450